MQLDEVWLSDPEASTSSPLQEGRASPREGEQARHCFHSKCGWTLRVILCAASGGLLLALMLVTASKPGGARALGGVPSHSDALRGEGAGLSALWATMGSTRTLVGATGNATAQGTASAKPTAKRKPPRRRRKRALRKLLSDMQAADAGKPTWWQLTGRMAAISQGLGGPAGNLTRMLQISQGAAVPVAMAGSHVMQPPLQYDLFVDEHEQDQREGLSLETETNLIHASCAVIVEGLVNAIGLLGLVASEIGSLCNKKSPGYDRDICGGAALDLIAQVAWLAAGVLEVPGECGMIDVPNGTLCAADQFIAVGTVGQMSAGGLFAKTDCDGSGTITPFGGVERRLREAAQGQPSPGEKTVTVYDVLRATGSLGSGARRARRAMPTSWLKKIRRDAQPWPFAGDAASADRQAFVADCYINAENSVAIIIDVAISGTFAVEICGDAIYHGGPLEDQMGCAAEVANFMSDFAALVASTAIIAGTCPVNNDLPKFAQIPCVIDWADIVNAMLVWAVYGASVGEACFLMQQR